MKEENFIKKIFDRPETEIPLESGYREDPAGVAVADTRDTLRSEHLKEGVQPIVAAVGAWYDFDDSQDEELSLLYDREKYPENSAIFHHVDFYGEPGELHKNRFSNGGEKTYVISPVDNKDKVSTKYIDCTGLIVTGKDKESGEDISFASHQDPYYFLSESENTEIFLKDLHAHLKEIQSRCEAGTIDAVIVGGDYNSSYKKDVKYYKGSIYLLANEVSRSLGFEPVVITGPKIETGADHIYYNNKKRRLFIIRPSVGDSSTKSYLPRDMKKEEKKWRKDEGKLKDKRKKNHS